MANTTNFNWETPDDTDLVKDGAAAIRTLGSAIDTSLVDLKGGTTGQILSKTTNTDMDFTWITNDVGDITAVSAGTGITGGGTSGAITITNDMATTITAAGDIVVGTGSGTYDNLPIGTTGQVLTADTTVSPYKVKWAAAAGGGKVLQVVQGTLTGIASRNATSFGDTGITVSITPSATTSKVLVIGNVSGATKAVGNANARLALQLVRVTTAILDMSDSNGYTGTSLDNVVGTVGFTYLDSPATTSATTYKIQFASGVSGQNVYINDYRDASDTTVSTIIVMEIGA